ncbi:MAG: pyrroline-5-carboxylate reductase [Peptostreptococcaceae bacterium]|nr:pyrroline-5-carboxylate reductase [Peptostreptococcaceae bacterium]
MKYGFLGTGKMASAIIAGMTLSGYNSNDILGFNKSNEKIDKLVADYGIGKCNSQKELIATSDVLFLAVKPSVLDEIIEDVKSNLSNKNILIISIAVGKTLSYFEEHLDKNNKIVRVMPNINSTALASTSGYCFNSNVSIGDIKVIEDVFGSIGTIEQVKEDLFSIFAAIAGSSPAFTYMYIDALAAAAVKAGMPKKQALKIAANTVKGSSIALLNSDKHPCDLIDDVCSPNGTTIEGVSSLKINCFEGVISEGIDAILKKDKAIKEG